MEGQQELTKRYYRIREVSEILGVPLSTLRYWESTFPQLTPKRNDKGTRYYTPANIETLRQIKYLVHDKGLKIEAAAQQMKTASHTVATRAKTIERLEEIRAGLVGLRDALSRMR